jgi:hypothetical protein
MALMSRIGRLFRGFLGLFVSGLEERNPEARAQELERRILANHQAGNLELAGTLARELQELKADLSVDTAELQETENAYQSNLRQAKLTQKEFEDRIP